MRVRYDLFNQPIPSFAVSALDAVAKSVLLDVRNRTLEIALLFMEERFPVRDEELHITHLWDDRSWGNRFRSKYRAIE